MNRTSLIVAIIFLSIGILVGMTLAASGGTAFERAVPSEITVYCQDALARRAQAEQALSTPSSDSYAALRARSEARAAFDRAVSDIATYCRQPH